MFEFKVWGYDDNGNPELEGTGITWPSLPSAEEVTERLRDEGVDVVDVAGLEKIAAGPERIILIDAETGGTIGVVEKRA